MDSVMFNFGILQIKWYSFFILVALILSSFLIYKEAKRKGIKEEELVDILFYGILIGIIGARIYYIIFNLSYYIANPKEIIMVWHGGLAIHGGLIATLIFLIIYSNKKKINTLLLTDIIVVGLLLAQAIGRWGNFFNQEAYGRIVSVSFLKNLHIPSFIINGMYIDGYYREPTFLYESILSLIGFILLLGIRKNKNLKVGQLTGIYLLWYGTERILIEALRSDSLMLGPIKVAQLVSIIFIGTGIYFVIKSKKRKKYREEKLMQKKEEKHV